MSWTQTIRGTSHAKIAQEKERSELDWEQATAEALILFHGCKINNIVIEIICKKYIN